jgi:hypothetical protein
MVIDQETYARATLAVRFELAKIIKGDEKLQKAMKRAYPRDFGGEVERQNWSLGHDLVKEAGRIYMKAVHKAMVKAGVNTALGFNFYDLRGPALFIFPLLTPLIQSIPKTGKVNAGVGKLANWKATTNPNTGNEYVGLSEGTRGPIMTPNEVDYYASYKELGADGAVTFTAQFAGEGFTDNQADEHFRNLARLRLGEEMMTLAGNAGPSVISTVATGNLGFALGTCPTPAHAVIAGSLAANSNVYVACVAITAMGMGSGGQAGYGPVPSVANGVTGFRTRTGVDASSLNINCGVSQISAISTVQTCTSAFAVNASVTAVKGAVAYAWYWGVNVASALGNLNLGAITSAPWVNISAVAAGNQLANVASFGSDASYQQTDFDGLMTYAFVSGQWTDMGGGSFTPTAQGEIAEIETDLQTIWTKYQAQPDDIYCSADVRTALDAAATYTGSGQSGYMFVTPREVQGTGILAGFIVSGYKSKYSINPSGGTEIPIRIHPMLPPGTLMYDIKNNPYPHSKIPFVRAFMLQRDYYGIEWPVTTRQWTMGTYIHEVLAHYVPGIATIRTGIGKFVAPCYLAALAFGEDFYVGEQTQVVRDYLSNTWAKTSKFASAVVSLYAKHGERVSKVVAKSSLLKRLNRALFEHVLARATAVNS